MDITELIVTFYNFGKAPRKVSLILILYYTLYVKKIGEDKENLRQNHNMKIPNKPCKYFKVQIFGNDIKKSKLHAWRNLRAVLVEDVLSRLNSGHARYISTQNLLSSRLSYLNLKFKIPSTKILPVTGTCSLTLSEEHMLMVLENKVLRKILGSDKVIIHPMAQPLYRVRYSVS
jgi:hypothetical protein